ncbi:MAG: hypothetical protein LBL30_02310 [Holosporales bacterium]|nr:hypothetical protein [Holosporales bacterium]
MQIEKTWGGGPNPLFGTSTEGQSCPELGARYWDDYVFEEAGTSFKLSLDRVHNFKFSNGFNLRRAQFEELAIEEAIQASEPCVSKPKLGLSRIQIAGRSNFYDLFDKFASMLFMASSITFLSGCSSPNKDSFRPHLYLGVTSNYSDSNATLEPKYFVPGLVIGDFVSGGFLVGRNGVVTVPDAAGAVPARPFNQNGIVLGGIDGNLATKNSGIGTGAIVGLEMKVFKLRMSLEADCSNINYGKDKQKDNLFEKFSFGLSYRLGLKLGNYFTPYLLAGVEFSTFKGRGENPHFRDSGDYTTDPNGAGRTVYRSIDRLFYNIESSKMIQSPRLGCGFEISFFERFKFRFDAFWTLKRRFAGKFRTDTVAPVGVGFDPSYGADAIMTWYHKKFSTRFGIIMDL